MNLLCARPRPLRWDLLPEPPRATRRRDGARQGEGWGEEGTAVRGPPAGSGRRAHRKAQATNGVEPGRSFSRRCSRIRGVGTVAASALRRCRAFYPLPPRSVATRRGEAIARNGQTDHRLPRIACTVLRQVCGRFGGRPRAVRGRKAAVSMWDAPVHLSTAHENCCGAKWLRLIYQPPWEVVCRPALQQWRTPPPPVGLQKGWSSSMNPSCCAVYARLSANQARVLLEV